MYVFSDDCKCACATEEDDCTPLWLVLTVRVSCACVNEGGDSTSSCLVVTVCVPCACGNNERDCTNCMFSDDCENFCYGSCGKIFLTRVPSIEDSPMILH